jgi:hypothetical protein
MFAALISLVAVLPGGLIVNSDPRQTDLASATKAVAKEVAFTFELVTQEDEPRSARSYAVDSWGSGECGWPLGLCDQCDQAVTDAGPTACTPTGVFVLIVGTPFARAPRPCLPGQPFETGGLGPEVVNDNGFSADARGVGSPHVIMIALFALTGAPMMWHRRR